MQVDAAVQGEVPDVGGRRPNVIVALSLMQKFAGDCKTFRFCIQWSKTKPAGLAERGRLAEPVGTGKQAQKLSSVSRRSRSDLCRLLHG